LLENEIILPIWNTGVLTERESLTIMVFCEMFFIGTLAAFTFFEVWLFRRFCLSRGPISKSEHVYRVPGGYYVVRYYPEEKMYY